MLFDFNYLSSDTKSSLLNSSHPIGGWFLDGFLKSNYEQSMHSAAASNIKGIKGFSLTSIYKHNNFCFLAFKIKDRGNVNYPTVC